jgi:hypothetical protein
MWPTKKVVSKFNFFDDTISKQKRENIQQFDIMGVNHLACKNLAVDTTACYNPAVLGISLAVGQRTLDPRAQVRILDPQLLPLDKCSSQLNLFSNVLLHNWIVDKNIKHYLKSSIALLRTYIMILGCIFGYLKALSNFRCNCLSRFLQENHRTNPGSCLTCGVLDCKKVAKFISSFVTLSFLRIFSR